MTITLAACLLTAVVIGGIAWLLGYGEGSSRMCERWAAAEQERAERERGAGLQAEREVRRQRARLEIN